MTAIVGGSQETKIGLWILDERMLMLVDIDRLMTRTSDDMGLSEKLVA